MRYKSKNQKASIYIAAPLFSSAERNFNTVLKKMLKPYFNVYLPQEDGGLMVDMIKNGMALDKAEKEVFKSDMQAINKCDIFLIILDGRAVDEGAAFELGCAYMLSKPCFGLKTDPRQLLQHCNNPMIDIAVQEIFISLDDLVSWAKRFVKNHLSVFKNQLIQKESGQAL